MYKCAEKIFRYGFRPFSFFSIMFIIKTVDDQALSVLVLYYYVFNGNRVVTNYFAN